MRKGEDDLARLRPGVRRIVERFAAVVCPPDLVELNLTADLLHEFAAMLATLPPAARRLIPATLVAFDRAARLHTPNRGRRFVGLDDARADAYLATVLAGRAARPLATPVTLAKSLVIMSYYELPAVAEGIGYRPAPYIAQVARRRLERYGDEIRAGEAATLGPDEP